MLQSTSGGTTTRIGAFESTDMVAYEALLRFETSQVYVIHMAKIYDMLDDIEKAEKIKGIGVSFGAQITPDGERIGVAPNLRDFEGKALRKELTARYDCPVVIAHDTVCGALGEAEQGVMQGVDRFAYLTISTGTGGALHQRRGNNRLISSIEFGHQIIEPHGRKCLCGQRGCLETFTGGRQIFEQTGQHPHEIDDMKFWRTFIDRLATGIVNVTNLNGVQSVVLGGGIALNNDYLRVNLPARVTYAHYRDDIQVKWSALGEDAPLIGALNLLRLPEDVLLH